MTLSAIIRWVVSKLLIVGLLLAVAVGSSIVTVSFTAIFNLASTAAEMVMPNSIPTIRKSARREQLKLKNELNRKRSAAIKLEKRVSQRVAATTTRNLSASVGEAIPWVGAGVIAGATALELKDACDTMKDLRAFRLEFGFEATVEEDTICGLEVMTKDEMMAAIYASPEAAWQKAANAIAGLSLPKFSDYKPSWGEDVRDWISWLE